jgi:signal transduction histidine kinase
LVLLIAFAALSFVESHRTFGAAYNLACRVREISTGRFGVRVRLRKNDTLQTLARSVNDAAENLEAGARAELKELERLHSIAVRQGASPELERGIATLVERRRDLLS